MYANVCPTAGYVIAHSYIINNFCLSHDTKEAIFYRYFRVGNRGPLKTIKFASIIRLVIFYRTLKSLIRNSHYKLLKEFY